MNRPTLGMRSLHLVLLGQGEKTSGPVKCFFNHRVRQRVVDKIHEADILAGVHDLLGHSQSAALTLRIVPGREIHNREIHCSGWFRHLTPSPSEIFFFCLESVYHETNLHESYQAFHNLRTGHEGYILSGLFLLGIVRTVIFLKTKGITNKEYESRLLSQLPSSIH